MTGSSAHAGASSLYDEELTGDELTPWQRVGRNLISNRLAVAGGLVLLFFVAVALIGWQGTSGADPVFNPSLVRLPDKLMPPFSLPNQDAVSPEAYPTFGVYLLGTDELGRDVFARMLEGATVSMAVGVVSVGIAILLGVAMGGIAGFYGERSPGIGSLVGILATLGTGLFIWHSAGIFPLTVFCAGGLAGTAIKWKSGRRPILEGLGFGILLGLSLTAYWPQNMGLEFWLHLITWPGIVLLGGVLGQFAQEEGEASILLGAMLGGGLASYGVIIFPLDLITSLAILLLAAAILGAIAYNLDIRPVLRQWRLPRYDLMFIALVDVQLSFPTFFLILTVIALLPPSIWNIMIVIGVTGWVGPARFVRAEILSLRERAFVEAAVAMGAKDFRLIFQHLIPNSLAPVLVSATIGIAAAILTEAGLSFLGFGVPPPAATWGNILSDGKKFLFDAPWLTFIPGIAILIVVLAFNLFGEGLRDALNPRAKPE